ncbi:unnamed protein product, partial [Polarella glacialis]
MYSWLVAGLDFNEWAWTSTNGWWQAWTSTPGMYSWMVVIYPRLEAHGTSSQFQQGCWNVYGQTGLDYADKGQGL